MVIYNNLIFRKYDHGDNVVINNNYFHGKLPRVIINDDGVKLTQSYKIIGVDLID